MIRAVFFDMGGTLDGDGLHWLDRFVELYARAGVSLPRETVRSAFDAAERLAASDEAIMSARLEDMIDRHVGWQLEHLSRDPRQTAPVGTDPCLEGECVEGLRLRLVSGFVEPVRSAAAVNVQVLRTLSARGLQLGVVSNGCGNVDVLCDDLGYSPYLSLVVDSRRVGLYKPDPAIYLYAAARIGIPPASVMMVGDSFERDIRPARSIGMKTAWLEGAAGRACPDRSCVDESLRALADLPDIIAMVDAKSRDVA
jgi:putative hydrolase of the HAD superfamily